MHNSRDAKLFDNNNIGKQTRADQCEDSDDVVCQRICWIALQMAQEDGDSLLMELQGVEQKIEAKEQELLEATKAKSSSEVLALIKDQNDRLVEKQRFLLSIWKARLASPSGEVLACRSMSTGAMTQDPQLLGVRRKLLGVSLVTNLCHPVLRAFVCSSPWCKCHGLLCSLCWASVGLLLGSAALKVKST